MASTVTELLRRRFMGKSLPYDAEIEYLESSVGSNSVVNQYIDTGYLGTLNNKYEIKFTYYEGQAIFGSRSTNTNAVIISSDRCRFGGTIKLYALSANVTYIATLDKDAYIINGTTYNLGQTTAFTTSNNITLFSANISSVTKGRARIYYFKMWDGNTLVRDMIPVRIGTTGYMYDRVSGQLFGNAGTDDFILGNDK